MRKSPLTAESQHLKSSPGWENRVAKIDEQCENGHRADRPIRVCFLIDRLSVGGTESQLLGLIRHLDRSRVVPSLCLLDGEDATSRSLEPEYCAVLRLGVRSIRRPRSLTQAVRFAGYLRREKIDILQVYFLDSAFFGVVVARLAGVRHVLRVRNNLGYWIKPGQKSSYRAINNLFSFNLTNSDLGRDALVEQEGIDPSRIRVLDNGIDLDRFANPASAAARRAGAPRRVGVVANLRPVKGLDVFLRAAALVVRDYPDVQFPIAGEGPERARLEALAAELDLTDRVQLLGLVGDVPSFLADLDVVVQSSLSEGLSNAVIESMAAGRPVVATAVGANPNLIQDGINGLLVPPGDHERLAEAIKSLLRHPNDAAKMGDCAVKSATKRFSWSSAARAYQELCHQLSGPQFMPPSKRYRSAARCFAVTLAILLTAPLWIPVRIEGLVGSEVCFSFGAELLSLMPGAPGVLLRRGFYRMTLNRFAITCSLGFGTTVSHRQTSIGEGVYSGNRCSIGQAIIENHVTMGCNVDILSGKHQHFFEDLDRPIQEQGGMFEQVVIGTNCWIGNSTVIMADIGASCVIGAGSVVVKSLPARSIAVGNPARVVRSREPDVDGKATSERPVPASIQSDQ